jgi:Cu/Ag efflux protein CusF
MLNFRFTAALLAGLASALIATPGLAAEEVRGVIASVDPAKNELHLEGRGPARGATLTFTLDDKTLVLFGAEKARAADLRAGRRVRIKYEQNANGQRIARVVRDIGRPPVAPVAATAPAAMAGSGDAITGVLRRVARADRELVVIGPGSTGPETETTVAVPEMAKVMKEGKPSSLEALKEGDAVAIRAERRDGRLTALEVQAGPGAALSSAPAPERGRMVPRIRQALHLADEVLRHLDADEPDRPAPKKP